MKCKHCGFEPMSADEIGIFMLQTYRGCSEETARSLWTGKHHQFEQKTMFAKLAKALSGKVGKQDIEKRLEGIEEHYEEMKEGVEDKEATPEMRSNARSFIRGMDYIRKHMRL